MARDPECFKFLNPTQILTVLALDAMEEKHTTAKAVGAKCANCLDTGMNGGLFCNCSSGSKLGLQSHNNR